MQRVMTSVAAVVLGLAMVANVQAGGKGSKGSGGGSSGSGMTSHTKSLTSTGSTAHSLTKSSTQSFNKSSMKKGSFGTYYCGKSCNFWSSRCYDSRYGCSLYFDPCCSCYYYFCVPDDCYYPVTYCPYRCYTWPTRPLVQLRTVAVTAPVATPVATSVGTPDATPDATSVAPPPPPLPVAGGPSGQGK